LDRPVLSNLAVRTGMIDHTAVRNRLGQWATFLYDMHGELTSLSYVWP